jgi:hypothetical protein
MFMELKTSRNFTVAAHIAGWIIFLSIPLLLSPGPGITQYLEEPSSVYGLVFKTVVWVGAFYLNYVLLSPALLGGKNRTTWILTFLLVLVASSIAVGFIDEAFKGRPPVDFPDGPPHGGHHRGGRGPGPGRGFFGGPPFFSNVLITILVFAVSSLTVLWNNWREAKAREQERAHQKVAAELSMLKLQISPHFLFNTLNNIRWLIRSQSQAAEPAVLKLSQLLRYILYQTNSDRVALSKEVEHLQDFIALQEMRLTDKSTFLFLIEGDLREKEIVPLLFLPAAENFFKHGDFQGGYENRITLRVSDTEINFLTVNKVVKKADPGSEVYPGGIGLENIRKRLSLHYPEKHSFNTHIENEIFTLEMIIILN